MLGKYGTSCSMDFLRVDMAQSVQVPQQPTFSEVNCQVRLEAELDDVDLLSESHARLRQVPRIVKVPPKTDPE